MPTNDYNKLLKTKDFLKDREKYSLVYKMLKSDSKLFLTDEEKQEKKHAQRGKQHHNAQDNGYNFLFHR